MEEYDNESMSIWKVKETKEEIPLSLSCFYFLFRCLYFSAFRCLCLSLYLCLALSLPLFFLSRSLFAPASKSTTHAGRAIPRHSFNGSAEEQGTNLPRTPLGPVMPSFFWLAAAWVSPGQPGRAMSVSCLRN